MATCAGLMVMIRAKQQTKDTRNTPPSRFGLLMHVGRCGKRSKTEAMYCPARNEDYGDGDTSDLALDCGGTISLTETCVYLGSLLHRDLSDNHGVEARIIKAPKAFGALRSQGSAPPTLKSGLEGSCTRAVCSPSCCTAASSSPGGSGPSW